MATKATTDRTMLLDRMFDAPVALIYQIWTDPALVTHWWGVEQATNPVCELDVRPGGRWRIDMRAPSGRIYRNGGIYLEVVENARLVYSDVPDPAISEWGGEPPATRIHTVTFEDRGERTRVLIAIAFESRADRDRMIAFGMPNGIAQSLERLASLAAALHGGSPLHA